MTTAPAPAYDVTIIGGGLAGLTLALQLTQAKADLRILVLEKKAHPVDEAAHKVGESSVEIGAGYFTRFLGLLPHFQERQLPKLGLRYFFDDGRREDLTKRTELGGNVFFPAPSFQIDRGRFENFLGEEVRRRGVDFRDATSVKNVELAQDGAPHVVGFHDADGAVHSVQTRWVVDGAGRAAFLKRKLGLLKKHGHNANSVWWRYDRHVKIDEWSDDAAWRAQNDNLGKRWLSTVHFMGRGYWVWFIPLASGSHSVGIVTDGEIHPFSTMSSYDKAMEWLRQHEPQVAQHCEGREAQLQDFLGYKDFSYSCKQVYSGEQRWALIGEAGAFLDPFYSPGSDYIGMGNTFVTDLVLKDLAGEAVGTLAGYYDRIYFTFFENHLSLYEGQMHLWGDAKVMSLKIIWDFAYYWVIPAAFFFHRQLTNVMTFARHRDLLDRAGVLNRAVQGLFRDWHRAGIKVGTTFIDIPGIPFMYDLNQALHEELDLTAFSQRLVQDLGKLERLAGELLGAAQEDVPGLDASAFVGVTPVPSTSAELLATVLPRLRTVTREPAAAAGA
jgi:flavin-dependent dehydrogenase